jgi:putative ATPase
VPLHIRNAPTRLMKKLGYGRNYKYAHDYADAFDPQQYLPETLQGTSFFEPRDRGYEKLIKQRLDHWRRQMAKNMSSRKG